MRGREVSIETALYNVYSQPCIFVEFNGWGIFAPELNTIVPGTPAAMVLIENGSSEHVTHA